MKAGCECVWWHEWLSHQKLLKVRQNFRPRNLLQLGRVVLVAVRQPTEGQAGSFDRLAIIMGQSASQGIYGILNTNIENTYTGLDKLIRRALPGPR